MIKQHLLSLKPTRCLECQKRLHITLNITIAANQNASQHLINKYSTEVASCQKNIGTFEGQKNESNKLIVKFGEEKSKAVEELAKFERAKEELENAKELEFLIAAEHDQCALELIGEKMSALNVV